MRWQAVCTVALGSLFTRCSSPFVMGRTATYERMAGPDPTREYWKHTEEGFEFSMKADDPDKPADDKAYRNRRSAAGEDRRRLHRSDEHQVVH